MNGERQHYQSVTGRVSVVFSAVNVDLTILFLGNKEKTPSPRAYAYLARIKDKEIELQLLQIQPSGFASSTSVWVLPVKANKSQ